ncbi:hypothetical protein RUND412_008906 [Rhizina undulata]
MNEPANRNPIPARDRGSQKFPSISNGSSSEPELTQKAVINSDSDARTRTALKLKGLDDELLMLAGETLNPGPEPSLPGMGTRGLRGEGEKGKIRCSYDGCDKAYSRIDNLKRHFLAKHGELEVYADIHKPNDTRTELENLDEELLILAGEIPDLTITSSSASRSEAGELTPEPIDSSSRRISGSSPNLELNFHGKPAPASQLQGESQSKRFKCTRAGCDREYSNLGNLNRHISKTHDKR